MRSLAPLIRGERVEVTSSLDELGLSESPTHPDRYATSPRMAGEVRTVLAGRALCSNVPGMRQHTAEDIVRRATAAFNSGQPRGGARASASRVCAASPAIPCSHHLLAAVLFSQGEIEPARAHVETSLAKRPGNAAAHLLGGAHRPRGKGF